MKKLLQNLKSLLSLHQENKNKLNINKLKIL